MRSLEDVKKHRKALLEEALRKIRESRVLLRKSELELLRGVGKVVGRVEVERC